MNSKLNGKSVKGKGEEEVLFLLLDPVNSSVCILDNL